MLLECNEPKLAIISLKHIDQSFDQELKKIKDVVECVFIASEDIRERVSNICQGDDCAVISPTLVFILQLDLFLKKLMIKLEKQPFETIYITGNPDEIEHAHSIGLSTTLVTSDSGGKMDRSKMPDFEVSDGDTLIKAINGKYYGYFGELFAHSINGQGGFKKFEVVHHLFPEYKVDLYLTGRYFTKGDKRAYIHPLTQKILQMKKGYNTAVNNMAELLGFLNYCVVCLFNEKVDVFTMVPPRPNEASKLHGVINKAMQLKKHKLNRELVDVSLLKTVKYYPPQKEAGNWTNRFMNVKDAFIVTKAVSGHVAIFDDVITSGATSLECARMLYEAGADKVSVLAFGSSQTKSEVNRNYIKCRNESCCKPYFMKFRGKDGSAFFGCIDYKNCTIGGISYEEGRKKYNLQNSIFESNDIENFEF
jgi:predicted amidophosphoribosyltransferase